MAPRNVATPDILRSLKSVSKSYYARLKIMALSMIIIVLSMFIIILTWCNHHVPMAYHHVPMVCQNLSTVYYHVLCEFNVVSHFETDPAIVPALNCV